LPNALFIFAVRILAINLRFLFLPPNIPATNPPIPPMTPPAKPPIGPRRLPTFYPTCAPAPAAANVFCVFSAFISLIYPAVSTSFYNYVDTPFIDCLLIPASEFICLSDLTGA